jgi:hypothetical protein
MKTLKPKQTAAVAPVLNLNLFLTLNPSGPESKIKNKIKIKRGTA